MRVESELQPGQAARGDKLRSRKYLRNISVRRGAAWRRKPMPNIRGDRVVHTKPQRLRGKLAQPVRASALRQAFQRRGEQHREFCDIFGPEHILENVGEFLNYFMVSKVRPVPIHCGHPAQS